jgi:hypothetical protein
LYRRPRSSRLKKRLAASALRQPWTRISKHDAILIDRAPKIMQRTVDADENLVQVPDVTRLGPAFTKPLGELRPELPAPAADALVRDAHTPLRQDQFDVPQAQAEDVVGPDRVGDDRGGKPVTAVADGFCGHPTSLAQPRSGHMPTGLLGKGMPLLSSISIPCTYSGPQSALQSPAPHLEKARALHGR